MEWTLNSKLLQDVLEVSKHIVVVIQNRCKLNNSQCANFKCRTFKRHVQNKNSTCALKKHFDIVNITTVAKQNCGVQQRHARKL